MVYAVRGLNIMPNVVFLFDEEEVEKAEYACNCLTDLHNLKYGMGYLKYQEAHKENESFWDWICDSDEIYADKYSDYDEAFTDIEKEVMYSYTEFCEGEILAPVCIELSYHGEIQFITPIRDE